MARTRPILDDRSWRCQHRADSSSSVERNLRRQRSLSPRCRRAPVSLRTRSRSSSRSLCSSPGVSAPPSPADDAGSPVCGRFAQRKSISDLAPEARMTPEALQHRGLGLQWPPQGPSICTIDMQADDAQDARDFCLLDTPDLCKPSPTRADHCFMFPTRLFGEHVPLQELDENDGHTFCNYRHRSSDCRSSGDLGRRTTRFVSSEGSYVGESDLSSDEETETSIPAERSQDVALAAPAPSVREPLLWDHRNRRSDPATRTSALPAEESPEQLGNGLPRGRVAEVIASGLFGSGTPRTKIPRRPSSQSSDPRLRGPSQSPSEALCCGMNGLPDTRKSCELRPTAILFDAM